MISIYHFHLNIVKKLNKKIKRDKNLTSHIIKQILDYQNLLMINLLPNFIILMKENRLMENKFQKQLMLLKII